MIPRRILVVDDEPAIREVMSLLLTSQGYEVTTATDGFDALLQLKTRTSDLIISDLNMPNMSGFELLSVVHRRFPEIPVIAISGAYESGENVPGGVIADAFYPKGRHAPEELFRTVAGLIETSAVRAEHHQRQSAPVWVITCTECLRSFPINVIREDVQEIQEIPCMFCTAMVRYIVDFSVDVISTAKRVAQTKGQCAGC
jgi:CheY-like chemotaxis protein